MDADANYSIVIMLVMHEGLIVEGIRLEGGLRTFGEVAVIGLLVVAATYVGFQRRMGFA
jgi:hypothetical protein